MSSSSSSSLYTNIRNTVDTSGVDQRVEVNQRALIDKILARYASAGAVYRELLQNSNDAEAKTAEIYFTVEDHVVTEVRYRNDGMPFRPQDWSRLQKIAEGNPDVSKVGAFGVGAYTMFSICEEPLVISGSQALAFIWKGDALWCKVAQSNQPESEWTTFCLPSRDPYPLPDMVEFGQFLCASMTFTQCLKEIRLFVNDKKRLSITKETLQAPQFVEPPKSTVWWRNDGAVTSTPKTVFSLKNGIWESKQVVRVELDGRSATTLARYVSGTAATRIPPEMSRRMHRVTKKQPPKEVTVHVLLGGQHEDSNGNSASSDAQAITSSFAPQPGKGRIFIGFRTSQTTGLGAHLAAPLIPTVEREAIDLQDPTLRVYNTELLELGGIILRLVLEHSMFEVGNAWLENKPQREVLEQKLLKKAEEKEQQSIPHDAAPATEEPKYKTTSRSVFNFAKFMARSATKGIVSVVQTAFAEDTLLKPRDVLPLTSEERMAILLMQSFCPQPSTPDTLVGTALAQGFSRCLPNSAPPVLTRSGVIRGEEGRLPHNGMEQFVDSNIIRRVVYENAKEYHDILTGTQPLTLNDLVQSLSKQDPLKESKAITLIQWWFKFVATKPQYAPRGVQLKEVVKFVNPNNEVISLDTFVYYVDYNRISSSLPLPETVMPKRMQDKIGTRALRNQAQNAWFMELPIDVWAQYMSQHPSMNTAQPEDDATRLLVWKTLGQAWLQRGGHDKAQFGKYLNQLYSDRRCLPFDSTEPSQFAAETPVSLYLSSAELQAFEGVSGGSFSKVSQSLEVTEEFLLSLGVRKSVSIDFLFANLETLRWSEDPKPLIEYLRTASLTDSDLDKLRSTQYLPAENDVSRTFAPTELYLPNADLRIFPFLNMLQWPDHMTPQSVNGRFLQRLGVQVYPPLRTLLRYVSKHDLDMTLRKRCLEYLVKNLGNGGAYQSEYARMRVATLMEFPFLPTAWKEVLLPGAEKKQLQAPPSCFSDPNSMIMGFSVLDPEIEKGNSNIYGTRFRCPYEPTPDMLLTQLMLLVTDAKSKLSSPSGTEKLARHVSKTFTSIFGYLSSRSNEFAAGALSSLRGHEFIPCIGNGGSAIEWFKPEDVYFRSDEGKDSLTPALFHVVDFSPFLAAAGVKSDPTTQDLFRLMVKDPQDMLKKLGDEKTYKKLLRRIAANPPFRKLTPDIQYSAFLLAYKITEEEKGEQRTYLLAKASDIFIIDNSFYGRVFPVLRAPQESDLENFYHSLGSNYISARVDKSFQIIGKEESKDTVLTKALSDRIEERSPLLVSPSVTTRPLVKNAGSILSSDRLIIYQVDNLKAVYSLGNVVRNQRITCCAKALGKKRGLYVMEDFDWFDVGYAIGGLILQRCQLEDAFFIGSLLEAPVEQLRARGFPVDRILTQPEPEPEPAPLPKPPGDAQPAKSHSSTTTGPHASGGQSIAPAPGATPPPAPSTGGGKETILKQMFPDCDEDYIFNRLGPNPTMDDVRNLTEELAEGRYPRKGISSQTKGNMKSRSLAKGKMPPEQPSTPHLNLPPASDETKRKLGKRLGKALSGIRNNMPMAAPQLPGTRGVRNAPAPRIPTQPNDGRPVAPEQDTASHQGLENMLEQTVGQSTKVNSRGLNSFDRVMTEIPEGLSRNESGCEIIPGQSLKPFSGQYRSGKTHNGIRVFSARAYPASEAFLEENFHAVDQFADVIENLCRVYGLELSSVAIFHDPTGGTIAFNAGRALHFNLRFFYALHYSNNKQFSRECYSYWYTTMAHELAHHLVSAHNKEHGYYTESYVTMYLPKLVSLFGELEEKKKKKTSKAVVASKFVM